MPRGPQKIRYYGWMAPNATLGLDAIKWLAWLFLGWTYWLACGYAPQEPKRKSAEARCPECGDTMQVVEVTYEPRPVLPNHSLDFLDSG